MINNIPYLNLYNDAIESAIDTCENALKQVDLADKIEVLHKYAMQNLTEAGDFEHITNSIIASYFVTTQGIIKDKCPSIDTDYYVNCYDSHFYIDNEEVE